MMLYIYYNAFYNSIKIILLYKNLFLSHWILRHLKLKNCPALNIKFPYVYTFLRVYLLAHNKTLLVFAVLLHSKTKFRILNLRLEYISINTDAINCEFVLCLFVLMCNGNTFYRFIYNISAKTEILLLLLTLLDI